MQETDASLDGKYPGTFTLYITKTNGKRETLCFYTLGEGKKKFSEYMNNLTTRTLVLNGSEGEVCRYPEIVRLPQPARVA